jgi:hypothetical protein
LTRNNTAASTDSGKSVTRQSKIAATLSKVGTTPARAISPAGTGCQPAQGVSTGGTPGTVRHS